MSLSCVHETSITGMLKLSQFWKDLLPRKPADRVEKVRKISRGSKHFAKLKAKHNCAKTQNYIKKVFNLKI